MDSLSLGTHIQNPRRAGTIPCRAPYRDTTGYRDGDPEPEESVTRLFDPASSGGMEGLSNGGGEWFTV
ncbi:hypothetical protein GCM10023096_01400 [Nonomuraea ferruginea]